MLIHRRRDGTATAWLVTAVNLHNGNEHHRLAPTVGPAMEAAHAMVAPGSVVYSRRLVGDGLELVLAERETLMEMAG